MSSFNKFIGMGNLTRDVEIKNLPSGTSVAEFGLAMNRKFKTASGEERDEVCFIDCAAFGKTGETIQKYFQKGAMILIEGRIKYETWEDKQSGGKRSKHSVAVDRFEFAGGKSNGKQTDPVAAGVGSGEDNNPFG